MAGGVPDGLALPLTATLMRMRGTDASPPRCAALAGEIGLQTHLSPSRANGFANMVKRIAEDAAKHA